MEWPGQDALQRTLHRCDSEDLPAPVGSRASQDDVCAHLLIGSKNPDNVAERYIRREVGSPSLTRVIMCYAIVWFELSCPHLDGSENLRRIFSRESQSEESVLTAELLSIGDSAPKSVLLSLWTLNTHGKASLSPANSNLCSEPLTMTDSQKTFPME